MGARSSRSAEKRELSRLAFGPGGEGVAADVSQSTVRRGSDCWDGERDQLGGRVRSGIRGPTLRSARVPEPGIGPTAGRS